MSSARDGTLRHCIPVAILLAVVAYFAIEFAFAGRFGPALDDGWIYLSFARGFISGDAFSYPGSDGPAGAITAPLWSFVLALAMAGCGANPLTMKVVGVFVFVFAVWAVGRLARAATADVTLARTAQLIVALSARVVWGSVSGMEAGLGLALASLGLALHLESRGQSLTRWLAAAAVLALAGWSRPENFGFLLLAALHRRQFAAVSVGVLLIATFPVYHQIIYGHLLPLPFYAKSVPGAPIAVMKSEGLFRGLIALCEHAGRQAASVLALLGACLPLLAPGLVTGVRRGLRERDGVPFLACALLMFVVARGAIGMQTPVFQQGRYFVQLWPLFVIVCLRGMSFVAARPIGVMLGVTLAAVAAWFILDPELAAYLAFDRQERSFPSDVPRLELALLWLPAAIFVLLPCLGWIAARRNGGLVTAPPIVAVVLWLIVGLGFGAVRQASGVRDTFEMNVAMAQQVAARVPPGELVACHDIGALGWFGEHPLLDLAGLASPLVAFAPRSERGAVDVIAIIEQRRPRWLCLTDDMLAKLNPERRVPAGIAAWTEIEAARISSERNVTVYGDTYRLIRIDWQR